MAAEQNSTPLRVLIYSDDRTVRQQVHYALGTRLADDLPALELVDVATAPAVLRTLDAGGYDLVILDGEATPVGGMGLCHQIKDEIANCPPMVVLVARVQDAWLATWSRADAISSYPIDPVRLPQTLIDLLRATRADSLDQAAYLAPITH